MKDLLTDETKKIIVTLWFKNYQNDEEHNKRNLIIEGTLKKMISKCHPEVIYTEADLSEYNNNQKGYIQTADEWNVNLSELDEGPMVMIMYQQSGEIYSVTYNTLLVKLSKHSFTKRD